MRSVPEPKGISGLLSGRITGTASRPKRSRKKDKLTEKLPAELAELGDVLAAGRKVEAEVDFKLQYAEQRVKEFCLRRFCERYAETGVRPDSVAYTGNRSRFTFIQTRRITLTPEKAEAVRMLDVPLDEYTELRGLRVNYEAIRHHKLEDKLRSALEAMGLPEELLDECFVPDIQLKEGFFEHMSSVVSRGLRKGEKLDEKLFEVSRILSPGSQIRNAETPGMTAPDCFQLILDTEIAAGDLEEELGPEADGAGGESERDAG